MEFAERSAGAQHFYSLAGDQLPHCRRISATQKICDGTTENPRGSATAGGILARLRGFASKISSRSGLRQHTD
jgi:hypothetical protein